MKKKIAALILTATIAGSVFVISGCDSKETAETSGTTKVEEKEEDIEGSENADADTDTEETYVPVAVIANPDDFGCQTIKDFIKENEDNKNILMETMTGDRAANYDSKAVGVEEILIASDYKENLKTMFIKFDTIDNAKAYLGDELVGQKLEKTENSDGSIDYETKGDENKMYGKIYTDGLMTWNMKLN